MNNPDRDYGRIEKAIRYLENNLHRQPSLSEVARHVGLSDFHFQRVFSRWAGVSPKKFLQFLTGDYARSLLQNSRSVLDVAYDVGLSGGARLHDLTVNLYGMTPGEVKAKGTALTIRYGIHQSPFGPCFIATTSRGICALRFIKAGTLGKHLADLSQAWPGSRLVRNQRGTADAIRRIFGKAERRHANGKGLAVFVRGTPFQIKVWEALLLIPSGLAVSYQDLARRVGDAAASRAVGSAVGKNPVAYLIPCHRVIRSTGVFGEYRWDSVRKKALLGWEAAHRKNP
ncbi:MAG TPA: methylated-DNA--[protein]-cysteine S-methyltransferase [Nitrospiraceae bacterium]|jgi:AraC family transcriptional regulator of adaptative response/methylated-DNA-[protein]-cysteine methyltransferase|nr:methylated-DNA--[protein]-cysteine S-methyltransferase [Nitrospiraceae bacterium]